MISPAPAYDLVLLEETVWLLVAPTGLPSYDFVFAEFFACRRPWERPAEVLAVGRFGVTQTYAEFYDQQLAAGVRLIHTPEQYLLASELPHWYPRLAELTPRSQWFAAPPAASVIEQDFAWPVFVKAARQTSRKRASFSIVASAAQYELVKEHYESDRALQGQAFVCREYVPLRRIAAETNDQIPPAFEFRTFWWYGECVGAGPYWGPLYQWTAAEERAALALAGEAARRLALPFVAIDLAQTAAGAWIVIECNDGQESGYGAISPFALWQAVLGAERRRTAAPA